jgi:hypothetical protein
MSADPTDIEREYYRKLAGRYIMAVFWEDIDGRPLPILLLSGKDRDGNAVTAAVLADPEGNGPGFLEHSL